MISGLGARARAGVDPVAQPEFSRWLTHELRRRQWSQSELAEAVGVSQQTVSRWLAGRSTPAGLHVRPLARVLGTTSDDILNRLAPPEHSQTAPGA